MRGLRTGIDSGIYQLEVEQVISGITRMTDQKVMLVFNLDAHLSGMRWSAYLGEDPNARTFVGRGEDQLSAVLDLFRAVERAPSLKVGAIKDVLQGFVSVLDDSDPTDEVRVLLDRAKGFL